MTITTEVIENDGAIPAYRGNVYGKVTRIFDDGIVLFEAENGDAHYVDPSELDDAY